MKKKILLAFVLMCISILAFGMLNVSAEATGTYGYLTYEIENGEVTITDCVYLATEIVIPSEIDGKKVTAIAAYAFSGCTRLTSVTIPEGVTTIGSSAFSGCTELTDITIPEGVTTIGNSAFSGCTELTDITIPDSVKSIGEDAFKTCTNLTKITWNAKNVSDFKKSSDVFYFAGKSGDGIEVVFGDSVEYIPAYLFYDSDSYYSPKITSVTIGKSVTSIGDSAFKNCTNLTKITWNAKNVSDFTSSSAVFNTVGSSDVGIEVVFGDSVEHIPAYAFCGVEGKYNTITGEPLTAVTIGKNVTSIGQYAFYECKNIVKVNITNIATWCNIDFKVTTSNPLRYTKNLYLNDELVTDLVIPDGVTEIKQYAFISCESLTSVTIPESVTSIGQDAFYECKNIVKVNITNIATWCNIDFEVTTSNPLYYAENLYLNDVLLTDLVIPNGVTEIKQYAFISCESLTSITIPESVTSIGKNAFCLCTNIEKVNITDVGAWCNIDFSYQDSNPLYYVKNLYLNNVLITDLVIPDGVTEIKQHAFYNCTGLTSITIPESVTSIGNYAFENCTGLTKINWNAKNVSDFTSSSKSSFYNAGKNGDGIDVVFGDSVEYIPAYLFYVSYSSIPKITSVTIGKNVTSIGDFAFYKCTGLTSITIPENVTSIGKCAFETCTDLTKITWNAKNVSDFTSSSSLFYNAGTKGDSIEVVFGDSVEHIPAYLFYVLDSSYRPKIKKLTIGKNVTEIGENAFYNCSNITELTIPFIEETEEYGVFKKDLSLTFGYDLKDNLTKLTLTNEISISNNAFEDYEKLTDISLNDGITSIGTGAFDNCGYANNEENWDGEYLYLGNYLIGAKPTVVAAKVKDGTTVMIDNIFEGCTDLLKVTLPESMITISNKAFYGCTDLFSITLPSNIMTIGNSAFYDCDKITKINIPSTVTKIGNAAFEGCDKLDGVYITDICAWCKIKFGDGGDYWGDRYSNPLVFAEKLYINDVLVEDVVVPQAITQLNNYVFYNCSNLKTIKLPDNLTLIGEYAFCGCDNLKSVNIPASVTSIGTDAFDLDYSWRSDTRDVYITDLSAWCKLNFENKASNPLRFGANLYLNNALVKELSIPTDITTINKNQFYNCGSITAVKIHSNVEKIEENAFYNCKNIEYVEIPKDLFYIRNDAFYGCNNLAEVHYGGTESEWNEIIIADGNDSLKNAKVKSIYYITLIDDSGKTSSITCQPNSKIKLSDIEKKLKRKVTLYTDEAMTKEFNLQSEITGNLTLYVKLGDEITYTPGDINDDGEVTSKDVTVLLRYLAKNYNITVQEAALDVNGDGDITSKDVTILQRYITGGYGVVLK